MLTKTKHEEDILREISGLPENLQIKLARIIHFLKKEMMEDKFNENKATEEFLSVCGSWKDKRSIQDQINDISDMRKSTNRTENLF